MAKGWREIGTIGDLDWFMQTVHVRRSDLTPEQRRAIRAKHDLRWMNALKQTYIMPKPHIVELPDGNLITEYDQQSLAKINKHQEETLAWWQQEKSRREKRNEKRRAAKKATPA